MHEREDSTVRAGSGTPQLGVGITVVLAIAVLVLVPVQVLWTFAADGGLGDTGAPAAFVLFGALALLWSVGFFVPALREIRRGTLAAAAPVLLFACLATGLVMYAPLSIPDAVRVFSPHPVMGLLAYVVVSRAGT